MNYKAVFYILGVLLLILAAALLVPLAVAMLIGGEKGEIRAFGWAIGVTATIGAALLLLLHRRRRPLKGADGFGIVTLGWLAFSALGALPFFFADVGLSYTDCYFETISGFTTTGASVIAHLESAQLPNGIESLPRGLGFWRCMTQWLGGMGIVLLTVAILPMLGTGGYQLFRAEVPGPTKHRFTPRIRQTAVTLWKVYLVLSLAEVLLLLLSGLDLYDAVCHTFTTVSTAGFSTKNNSVGHYGSPVTEWIIIVFMFLAGVNFVVHYRFLFGGDRTAYFKSEELRWYAGLLLLFSCFAFVNLYGVIFSTANPAETASLEETIRKSVFTSTAIITTTGYSNADFDAWPATVRLLLLLGMFLGGCAGSTAGGLKTVRVMSITKYAWREIRQLFMPRAVLLVKVEGQPVAANVLASIAGFFFLWMLLVGVCSLILAAMLNGLVLPSGKVLEGDAQFMTALSAVISAIGNIGPGLDSVGPTKNYAHIPVAGKWLLTFLMLLGRLEIYSVLILLLPTIWRR